jgi:Ca-activated chloride channel family protein
MAEFYASARYVAGNRDVARLTLDHVNDDGVQAGVPPHRKPDQALLRAHHGVYRIHRPGAGLPGFRRPGGERFDLHQPGEDAGPAAGEAGRAIPQRRHVCPRPPFAIPNAPWVSEEQRKAAEVFTRYFLSPAVQQKVLAAGFRPANRDVPLGYPISPEVGVDPTKPKTLLAVPDPAVIATVQRSWQLVKKQADILLLVDTSGSMREDDKLRQAVEAMRVFLEDQPGKNNVGLMRFDSDVELMVPIGPLESNRERILAAIDQLVARGNTALYDAVIAAVEHLQANSSPERIQAVLLLSDGQDTASQTSLNQVVRAIQAARNSRTPILVIPVAYGRDADVNALNTIGRASDTKVQPGDAENIKKLLDVIGSYF